MIEQLNSAQQQAVTFENQHVLVLAGAGSGKTRVLTTRIAWLIRTQGVSPYEILAVTFTNKAAREMLTRIEAMLPINTQGMWVGTFHGLCNRLLRYHYRDAGLPQSFQILDSADQLAAIRRLAKELGYDEALASPRELQHFINQQKEKGLRAESCVAKDDKQAYFIDFYQRYQQQCEREGVVDFSELLLRAYELLKNNSILREHYQQRFKHLLIDEFQDTNLLQYAWLTLLAQGGGCVFAVGDDDQSIYAFRGADINNMFHFEQDFAKENVIRLEQNYRSTGHILTAANQLIASNNRRLGKNLWTSAGVGEPIQVCALASDSMEAQWVSKQITELLKKGYSHQDVAVLYRSNAQSRIIEHHLFTAGIPYRVYGGLRFFERQEIKHVLAYLRLIDNPHDDTSWLRIVNFPRRGIGARSIEQLTEQARVNECSLYRAVPLISGRAGSRLAQFVQLIQRMASAAQSKTLPELIQYVIEESGLAKQYQNEREGQERLENLQELVNAAAIYIVEESFGDAPAGRIPTESHLSEQDPLVSDVGLEPVAAMSPLGAFLTHASLEAGDTQTTQDQAAVHLMTVHAAKGLEFDAVFVTGMEEGVFPHARSLDFAEQLEEERRLMYVAMTRARKQLFLSRAHTRMVHGERRFYQGSCFLDELPEESLQWLNKQPDTFSEKHAPWGEQLGASLTSWQKSRGNQPTESLLRSRVLTVDGQDFRIGSGVRHRRFGEGTVLSLSGSGDSAQAEIHFREVGKKTLALAIAKLELIH